MISENKIVPLVLKLNKIPDIVLMKLLLIRIILISELICVMLSAEVPGQMKVFIDRCTPYCNTNPNRIVILHKTLGYAIALRTGPNPAKFEGIIKSINHYYGHMEIEQKGIAYFCGVNGKEDIEKQRDRIVSLCEQWFDKFD